MLRTPSSVLLVGAVALLAGCQPPSSVPTPEPRFWLSWRGDILDLAYLTAAEEAASDWNTTLGYPVFAFGTRLFRTVDLTQFPYRLEGSDGILAIGRTYKSPITVPFITVSTDIDKSAYRVIVEHELGHVLGLKHSSNPEDLMFTAPRWTARVSPDDKARALGILRL